MEALICSFAVKTETGIAAFNILPEASPLAVGAALVGVTRNTVSVHARKDALW